MYPKCTLKQPGLSYLRKKAPTQYGWGCTYVGRTELYKKSYKSVGVDVGVLAQL
jgi:hypothetical protein